MGFTADLDTVTGTLAVTGAVTLSDNLFIVESAAADADVAGRGQIWVKSDTPNVLMFTDDAGTDVQLGAAGDGGVTQEVVYCKGWITPLDISEITDVLAMTTDLTGVAAGDIYDVEITGLFLNNSGANRVTTWTLDFDGLFDVEFNQTLGFSATQQLPVTMKARLTVVSSSLSYVTFNMYTAAGIQTAGTDVAMGTSSQAHSWNTSATDITGTCTVTLHIRSANATGTQEFTRLSAIITKTQVF